MKKQVKNYSRIVPINQSFQKKKSGSFFVFSLCAISITALVFIIKGFIEQQNQSNLAQSEPLDASCQTLTGGFKLLRRIKRDNTKNAQYTQGLLIVNDTTLLESSGQYGKSSIHYLNVDDIETLRFNQKLAQNEFGEGCDIINNKVYQLTWQNRKIFVYNVDDLSPIEELKLDSKVKEGWGLTHRIINGETQVLITDGSNQVYVADSNFQVQDIIPIVDSSQIAVRHLNELEYVNGILYANIYLTSKIVAIDLDKKVVVATYDFQDLVKEAKMKYDECLNGIAYNENTKSFWITGKDWGFIQEVNLF